MSDDKTPRPMPPEFYSQTLVTMTAALTADSDRTLTEMLNDADRLTRRAWEMIEEQRIAYVPPPRALPEPTGVPGDGYPGKP